MLCLDTTKPAEQEKPVFWHMSEKATFTLHLHGVVTQLFIQVVGSASPRFACWQCHLDAGSFGTLCLAPGHSREKTQLDI